MKLGQGVYIEGGLLNEAISEGVRLGYQEGYLRNSIVSNPIYRVNTKDNTLAIIHYELVAGDKIEITLLPKGGAGEDMSKVYMLAPSQRLKGREEAVLETVRLVGPNACLLIVVCVGGNFEICTLLAKKALMRDTGKANPDPRTEELGQELLHKINNLGIGPQGLEWGR